MLLYYQSLFLALLGLSSAIYTGGPAVDLWISTTEAKRIFGEATQPVYIVRDGNLGPGSSRIVGNHGNVSSNPASRLLLPADVNSLKIYWRAPKPFHYSFMELRSSDPSIMGPPLLSITLDDMMPNNDTAFRIDFPCTGEQSGTASVSVIVRIQHLKSKLDIPASPIQLTFDKQCIQAPACDPLCANGGVCNRFGRCDCPPGFYGRECRIIFCIPHCYNSGTCISPGVCSCPKGYIGNRCQKAICDDDCNGHGYCYKPGFCFCFHGWTGANCERVDYSQYPFKATSYRSKNLRLVKNRRVWHDST